MKPKYLVVFEKAKDGSVSAYVPDLPGCVTCGDTLAEAKRLIREAIELHIQGLIEDGLPAPEPTTECEFVDSPAA